MKHIKSFDNFPSAKGQIFKSPILVKVKQNETEKILLGAQQDSKYKISGNSINDVQLDKIVSAICFTTVGNSNIGLLCKGVTPNLEYSKDGESWASWDYSDISINSTEKLYIRGNNPNGIAQGQGDYATFVITGDHVLCSGNIMNLLSYETELNTVPECGFLKLFDECESLYDASNLELPATQVSEFCYYYMFRRCYEMISAPAVLPAKTLAIHCYEGMFLECEALTNSPAILATTLANWCCQEMFLSCSNLTTVYDLLAETIEKYSYKYMFSGCYSLTTAPKILATYINNEGCSNMFSYCENLKSIEVNFTDWFESNNATSSWMEGNSGEGFTFTKFEALPKTFGNDYIPEGATVNIK